MPEEIWWRWRETMRFWLSYPGIKAWWYGKPTVFSPTFCELCERFIDEGYAQERPEAWDEWLREGTVAPEKR